MKLLELPLPFCTPADFLLPAYDDWGIPHGLAYTAFKESRTVLKSTRSCFRGMKFPRRFEALSQNEKRMLLAFAFNPYVLDVREQYPRWDTERFNRAVQAGKRMQRRDVMSIDAVVTLALSPDNRRHYHGVSMKPKKPLSERQAARQLREDQHLEERGWSWELLRETDFSPIAFANHFVMYRAVREQDVFSYYEPSKIFARVAVTRSRRGTMDDVMTRASRSLGISLDLSHQLFSVAVSFGFIYVDHTKELRPDKPLYLMQYDGL